MQRVAQANPARRFAPPVRVMLPQNDLRILQDGGGRKRSSTSSGPDVVEDRSNSVHHDHRIWSMKMVSSFYPTENYRENYPEIPGKIYL